jgi:thioredoxin-related protein
MSRRFLILSMSALAAAMVVTTPLSAARDFASLFGGSAMQQPPRYELLVFEREQCGFCEAFRSSIAPRYREGAIAQKMPIRFIDIDKADTDKLGLKTHLTVLPTAVVMMDGVEVDRVPGLVAPNSFFTLVQHILARTE